MRLITLFLLLGPGMLAWLIEGRTELDNWRDVVMAAVKWTVNCFLIMAAAYGIMYLVSGSVTVGLTSVRMDDLYNTIFQVDFVAKYAVTTAVLGVVLGLAERLLLPKSGGRIGKKDQ